MRWQTVIFDLDGTLVDTIGLIIASFRHAHRQVLAADLEEARIRPWIGRTLVDIYAEEAPDRAQELFDSYVAFNMANLERLQREFAGTRDIVTDLIAAGVRVGVATSKRREAATASIRAAGLTMIDSVTVLEDTERHKPAPDPIRHALADLGAAPETAVYVGDAVADVRAAQAAGVASVAVTWGAESEPNLRAAGPDLVVTTPAELRAALGLAATG